MKISVIERADGGISFAPVVRQQRPDETDAEFAHACSHRLLAAFPGSTWLGFSDSSDLPPSRAFRNAWARNGSGVAVDMGKARAIKMDRIRAERDRRLAETDKDVARLDGAAIPQPLKAKRQALRDIPQTANLDAIADPAALEAFEPVWP